MAEQDRRAAFVQQYLPYAQKWAAQTGIPAEVFLAIGASESNYGAAGSIFGIKGKSPSGQSRTYATWEMVNGKPVQTTDTFAIYGNPDEGFQHFVNLVQTGRYAPAWQYLQQTGDAAGWLQRVNQAGYATDPQWHSKVMSIAKSTIAPITGGQVKGTAMPTSSTSGTTTKRTTTPYQGQLDTLVTAAEAEYKAANERYQKLLAEYEKITDPQQKAIFSQVQLSEADRARSSALKAYTDAVRTAATNTRETETTKDPAAVARQNFDIVRAALGDEAGIAKGLLDLMEYNANRQREYVSDMVSRGRMAREDAEAVFTALNARQTQMIASFVQGLAAAKFISDARKDIVDRMLPPGTKYTFGPGNALFEQMQRMGMNPQPVEAVQVDKSYLEPEGILRQGMAMAPQVPSEEAMGITELRAQVAQNRAIPWPTEPKPVTAEQIGLPTALPYNVQDILDIINGSLETGDEEPTATPEQQEAAAHVAGMGPQDWGAPASSPPSPTMEQFVMWDVNGQPVYRDVPATTSPIEGQNESRVQGYRVGTKQPATGSGPVSSTPPSRGAQVGTVRNSTTQAPRPSPVPTGTTPVTLDDLYRSLGLTPPASRQTAAPAPAPAAQPPKRLPRRLTLADLRRGLNVTATGE